MTWWPRRRPKPDPPPVRPSPGNGVAARRAVAESQRRLDRARADVDEWTGEVRRLLGGQR